jgi:hypothetical protein
LRINRQTGSSLLYLDELACLNHGPYSGAAAAAVPKDAVAVAAAAAAEPVAEPEVPVAGGVGGFPSCLRAATPGFAAGFATGVEAVAAVDAVAEVLGVLKAVYRISKNTNYLSEQLLTF